MGVMFTGKVSNIIAWCHVYRDCVKYYNLVTCLQRCFKYYSLVSCIQRLFQILQLGVMFIEIVSNIIAWCHVYRDCFKYYSMYTKIVSNIYSLVSCIQRLSNITAWCQVYRDCVKYYILVSCTQRLCQIFIAWCHAYIDCVKY